MNAIGYNSRKVFLIKEGEKLIEKLSLDFHNRQIKIVLDIGCGTGIVTIHLKKVLRKVERIYAVDSTQELIDFAEQNNSAYNIKYLAQDLTIDWNSLRPELKKLEAKVDIIFSNYGFQWMYTKRHNLVQNIYRLLAKEGRVYANINYIPSPIKKMEQSDQSGLLPYITGKFPKIPSQEVQTREWADSFLNNGFEIVDYEDNQCSYKFDMDQFDKNFVPMSVKLLEQFYGFYYLSKASLFLMKYLRLKASKNMKKHFDQRTGKTSVIVDYENAIYVLSKK